jgi:hypothetical protein
MWANLGVTQLSLRIGRMLLEHGADPNARDEQDIVPLCNAFEQNGEDSILLLLEFGAEPGVSAIGVNPCILDREFPRVLNAYKEKTQKLCLQLRQEAKEAGHLKTCCVCQENKHCKRCSGCFLVWYCGADCQTLDWTKHKSTCLEVLAQYKPVVLEPVRRSTNDLSFERTCVVHSALHMKECK